MTTIHQQHLIESVADALQYISYYHSPDFISHMARAYEREQSPAAKDAIAQILTNSRLCAEGHRPLCRSRIQTEGLDLEPQNLLLLQLGALNAEVDSMCTSSITYTLNRPRVGAYTEFSRSCRISSTLVFVAASTSIKST